ncbi:MFS transporter [Petroclostridium sp. X23]|uniref:MFS transporter n=1 Tax=Petroclostridium sp. X23 TaxID=3045146 RepID=UPI0024ADD161|nr:MFS transporter [Petroclostridium sp. X23]WHH59737.1 MFS transporter [Petroclostridium sp. X23]
MNKRIFEEKWEKSFLIIFIGEAISEIGSYAVQFSLIWWIASKTSSPLMMALSGLMAFLPQFFLGPFVGVWIDRLKRKAVIIYADLFIGVVATVYAVFFLFGNPPYWSACVVLGIRAIANVFYTPAIQSVIPMLVPKHGLIRANGWIQFMQSGALMLGPVLGAAMYAVLPLPVILLSDLVGALVASISIGIIKIPELKREQYQAQNFTKEMKEGFDIFLQDKKLLIVTLAAAIGMIFYMPLSSFFPLMTSEYFHASAWHAGIVQFGYAGGMMMCSILVGTYGTIKNKLFVVHIGLLGLGLTSFFSGILPQSNTAFWIYAVLCTLMGASGNLYNIPYIAYMQETIPKEAHGRAFSVMSSLMSATMPLGLLIAGAVAEINGVASWFFITGVAFFIITGMSIFLTKFKRVM